MRGGRQGESRTNIRDYEETSGLEKQQNWIVLLSQSKSAFGTEMSHGQIKLTSEETLSFSWFKVFSIWFSFFSSEKREGIWGFRAVFLLREMLLGELYIPSGITSIRHYQAHTHVQYDKHLTKELTRTQCTSENSSTLVVKH